LSLASQAIVVDRLQVLVAGTDQSIVSDVSFHIAPGEVLGLVGESGCGKTTVGLALLGHARRGVTIASGSIRLGEIDVLGLDPSELLHLRGRVISYVPQDPAAALNPAVRIGTQLREILEAHNFGANAEERRTRVIEMMREVALPDDSGFLKRYPHELSGGQQQRVGLAIAFACRPRVIVLDEPTTGLDVTTQAHVLGTVRELAAAHRVAALYVSHDLAVVGTLASRVAVMYAGRIVELGPVTNLFQAPAHPYTQRLVAAVPHLTGGRDLIGIAGRAPSPGRRPPGCAFAPRCAFIQDRCTTGMPELRPLAVGHQVRCVRAEEIRGQVPARNRDGARILRSSDHPPVLSLDGVSAGYRRQTVVHDVTLELARRECLALVGESGSGKTTLARSVAGLHSQWSGQIVFNGAPLEASARERPREQRRLIQYVFQNPYGSLNPRHTVGQTIRQPLEIFG
jgi:peptide/nickel transport system ATP-binding protein